MLGLLGTVAGAAALEIKRLQKRGSVEELRETKKRERELRELLEVSYTAQLVAGARWQVPAAVC